MRNFWKFIRERLGLASDMNARAWKRHVRHSSDRKPRPDPVVSLLEEKYPEGTRLEGCVTEFHSYGAVVAFEEGIFGLLHNSKISWGDRFENAADCFCIGDVLSLVVIGINKDKKRLELSYRELNARDPWNDVEQTHPVGAKTSVRVRRLVPYGVFVTTDNGIAALLHKTKIPATCSLEVGQVVDVIVINVDSSARKMGVAMDAQYEVCMSRADALLPSD